MCKDKKTFSIIVIKMEDDDKKNPTEPNAQSDSRMGL
jgi:hypothetical protein